MVIQWKLGITRSLGLRIFFCYIRYFVISVVNKQYKTKEVILFLFMSKEINSLGPEKLQSTLPKSKSHKSNIA